MKAIHLDSALVEVEWLKEHLGADRFGGTGCYLAKSSCQ